MLPQSTVEPGAHRMHEPRQPHRDAHLGKVVVFVLLCPTRSRKCGSAQPVFTASIHPSLSTHYHLKETPAS